MDSLKQRLPGVISRECSEKSKFKDLYQFTFNFAKNPGQKGLGRFHLNALFYVSVKYTARDSVSGDLRSYTDYVSETSIHEIFLGKCKM